MCSNKTAFHISSRFRVFRKIAPLKDLVNPLAHLQRGIHFLQDFTLKVSL